MSNEGVEIFVVLTPLCFLGYIRPYGLQCGLRTMLAFVRRTHACRPPSLLLLHSWPPLPSSSSSSSSWTSSNPFVSFPGLPLLLPLLILLLLAPSHVMLAESEVPKGFEEGLLSALNLPRRPRLNPSMPVVVPEVLSELYRLQTGLELDTTTLVTPGRHTRSANTVRTFTHSESTADQSFSEKGSQFRLLFDVSSIPQGEILQAAELQLSRTGRKPGRARILVHEVVRPGKRGSREPLLRLLDTQVANGVAPVTLDVLPAVQRWRNAASSAKNHGLLVEVISEKNSRNHGVRLRRSLQESPSNEAWLKQQPLLLTYTDDVRHKSSGVSSRSKVKRGASSHKSKRKEGHKNCQRKALYVNFEEVGWNDWIVAPPGYDAFYCHGECEFPLAEHLNTTNHAVVQTLMHSMSPGLVPRACCVPTELSSISMLYLDEDKKVVLKNYKDMAIVGCGCR